MSEIEPPHNQDDGPRAGDEQGGLPGGTRITREKKPVPGGAIASALAFLPMIGLSVVGILILLSETGPDFGIIAYCVMQIVVLVTLWIYLRKLDSWGKVLLGIAIGVGFYLLTFSMCGSLVS